MLSLKNTFHRGQRNPQGFILIKDEVIWLNTKLRKVQRKHCCAKGDANVCCCVLAPGLLCVE